MGSKIRLILEYHWEGFLRNYGNRIRTNVKREVEKVLKCGDIKNGYIELKCENCNETKKVGFTCKSRFCTSCGKIYVDNWIENMLGNLINVRHRHIVFTIPEELREYFQRDRQKLKILPKCAADTIMSWMKEQNKREQYTPGIVTVIHIFGRDLKCNPHVHMMVTEGGKGNIIEWKHFRHIPHIPEKNFKMIRYFGIYSRRSKGKNNLIKIIDERIIKARKSLAKWEYRIMASFGVDQCRCPKCNGKMRFNDIVYGRYGSIKEYLRLKIIDEGKQKLEDALELYAATKGILCGKINSTAT